MGINFLINFWMRSQNCITFYPDVSWINLKLTCSVSTSWLRVGFWRRSCCRRRCFFWGCTSGFFGRRRSDFFFDCGFVLYHSGHSAWFSPLGVGVISLRSNAAPPPAAAPNDSHPPLLLDVFQADDCFATLKSVAPYWSIFGYGSSCCSIFTILQFAFNIKSRNLMVSN